MVGRGRRRGLGGGDEEDAALGGDEIDDVRLDMAGTTVYKVGRLGKWGSLTCIPSWGARRRVRRCGMGGMRR